MRNFLLLLAAAALFLGLGNSVSAQYCTTNLYTTGCSSNDFVNSFSTTGGITNITNNTTGCSPGAYIYYSGMTHTAIQGNTVNFSFTNGPNFSEFYKVWVDYNGDGTYSDVNELVYTNPVKIATNEVVNASFVIPITTTPGIKRMRIRAVFSNNTFTACSQETWGEVEEYNLLVQASGPCTNPPSVGSVTASANPSCSGTPFSLGISGGSFGSGQTYKWQSSTDGTNWSDIPGATTPNFNISQTVPTYYRYEATCGTGSATSASLLVGTIICYCPSLPTSVADEEIFSFTLNGVTNAYPCNVVAPGPGSILQRYSNFYPLGALTTLVPGTVIDFEIKQDECDGPTYFSNGSAIWIDFNQDGIFDDATERVFFETTTALGPRTITGNITVPATAKPGVTGLRVIVAEARSGAQLTSCMSYGFGETEDYLVNIIPPTPCSGAPVAGNVTAFPTTVCLNQQVSLKNTDAVLAVGQSYQWQVSTDNVNWTDIAGARNFIHNTTQSVTSWYRFKITCDVTNDVSYTAGVQVYTPPILTGVYTIDKAISGAANLYPNTRVFNSFNSAYEASKCGIGGPVIFNVQPGAATPYNEQLIMNGQIPNTSAVNTITFNGNGNIITFNTTATEPAVIKLKNIDFIRFENLVINPTGATNGHGVHLTADANNNIVRSNTINLSTTATSGFAGVVISGSETDPIGTGTTTALCDGNEIRNNTINGGAYGVTVSATFANGAHGNNIVAGNTIRNYYESGIFIRGTYNTLIDSNTLSRPNRTTSPGTVRGIHFTQQSDNSVVSKNRITNPFGAQLNSTAAFNAIDFVSCNASTGSQNEVRNNLVYKMNGVGAITGLNNDASANTWYVHNTVSLDSLSTAAVNTRGFATATAATGILFYNNLISVTRTGPGTKYAIYIAGLLFACDYNNYYISASGGTSALGYYNSNHNTLALWQSATGHDANSLSRNPAFVNVNNGVDGYKPGNGAIDNKAIYLGVDTDILDQIRGGSPSAPANTRPDIGAYEFLAPPCSVPPVVGSTVISPTGTVCQQTTLKLDLNITSFGSQTFQWQTAPAPGGPWSDLGTPLVTPDTSIVANVTSYYRAMVSCGSAVEYSNPILITVTPAMPAGTYTIDKTHPGGTTYIASNPVAGTNFVSFNAARVAMQACGILGSVVFDVVPLTGPYNEQLKLDSIRGASATNTVTFNGNGNTIAFNPFAPPNTNERAVIKLNRADHITFDSLRIQGTGAFSFAYGVQLINNADSNTFKRCTILVNSSSTAANFGGVVINSADAGLAGLGNTLCDGNVFSDNTINGGYYGVTIVGNSAPGPYIENNKFLRNKIEDFYSAGFYVAGTYNTLIEGNDISRNLRTSFTDPSYGIFVTDAPSPRLTISKNRIHHLFRRAPNSNAAQYIIHHNNVDVTAGNDNVVSNNVIYGLEGNGIIYGLYNISSDGVRYYHNTVSLDNRASISTQNTRGFYQAGTPAAVGIEFINNIITIVRSGTGTKHGIHLETTTSEVTSNYNNIYVRGGGSNNFFGFSGGVNRLNLAAWKAANPTRDANSFSEDPIYVDSANGNYAPGIKTIDDVGTWIGVATDVLDNIRNPLTPDIGAYEFIPIQCVNPPIAGTASVTPASGMCLEAPIVLNLTGFSQLGTLTFQWQSAPTSSGPWTNIGPILYSPQFNTITGSNTFYRAEVVCGTGTPVYSTTTQVVLNNVLLAGTYTIDNSLATNWPGPPGSNFRNFADAVTAMNCGITGPVVFNVKPGNTSGVYTEQVRIPYIKNSSAINTITFQSDNGNAASAILTFAATAGNNYTLKLDGAKHVTFQNMTIRGTNSTAGRVVEIADTASLNRIYKCVITAPSTLTNNTNTAGVYANALKGSKNLIRGNVINNGAHGVYFWGTSATALTEDNVIDSNIISSAYVNGIYANNHKRAKIVGNTVNVTTPVASIASGIFASDCDSSYVIERNRVNVTGVSAQMRAIQIVNSDSSTTAHGIINANIVSATTGNSGALTGLYIDNSPGHKVTNNVVAVSTTSTTSYGLYTNSNIGIYHHNTINSNSANGINGGTNYTARFDNPFAAPRLSILNNIFTHRGGGRALYVESTLQARASDYNMLYTSGSTLVQRGNPAGTYANLDAWRNGTFWDKYSISYVPAYISNTDLRPNLSNPDVWAMHGRGIQVKGDTLDIDGNYRPDSLTAGVPDLGAYEFFPTVQPTVLTAIPAVPAPGQRQSFMYGSDTVVNITWGATVPPSVAVRRFSGVVPPNPPYPNGTDSMFFYVQVETPGDRKYEHDMRLHYLDPWQGSIPEQWMLGLGRYTEGNNWVVGFSSRVDVIKKTITQAKLSYLDKFTGFVNPYAPPVLPDKDTSNRGRRFWVSYPINQLNGGGGQEMVLYLSAEEPANVTVKINGTNWVRNYTVAAYSVTVTENLPKTGPDNAFLNSPGLFDRGIYIESDVPIVAYAHYIGSASSGAAVLLPVSTWGWEYKSLSLISPGYSQGFSYVSVIADNDNSVVEITPTVPVQNPGFTPNVPTLVTLNKGEVFQLVSTSSLQELTGTVVKSLQNSAGVCYPVAVFSGNARATLTPTLCSAGSGGDFVMQQNFPATAWGKRYLTAPTSASTDAALPQPNKFRVAVRDPATVVKRNGVTMTPLINGHYYEYESNTADYIEADKAVMVAQYLTGSCVGVGDPEMIYLSPHEQGIQNVSFYRNNRQSITTNYVTLIIPSSGMASLRIEDGSTVVAPDHVYDHPQSALFGEPYKVVITRFSATPQQVRVTSDKNFMGITYGLGSVESYGYNVGFFLKNLQAAGNFSNTLSTIGNTDFTCVGSPFTFTLTLPIQPTSLTFHLNTLNNLTPNSPVSIANPVPASSAVVGRDTYYTYKINSTYTFNTSGIFRLPVTYTSPEVEGCNSTKTDTLYIQVVPAPKTDFTINFSGCENESAQFTGDIVASNGSPLTNYEWTLPDGSKVAGPTSNYNFATAGTYNVNLYTITADGCIGDSTKQVVVNPRPAIGVVTDSIAVCPGGTATYTVQSPLTGATYNWYNTASGGTVIATGGDFTVGSNGTTFTVQNIAASTEYFVEAVSADGCISYNRQRVKAEVLGLLPSTTPAVTSTGVGTVTFGWSAVPGAVGYEVSINGAAFITPSAGATGTSHVVSGLGTLDSVNFVVRALGAVACQNSMSAYVTGCENSQAQLTASTIATCVNGTVTFNVQNPASHITYSWYSGLTGGTAITTGSSFTTPALAATQEFYVEQVSNTGCIGSPRTKVTAEILTPLTTPAVTHSSSTANSVTFSWTAVAGATSYEVSVNNGAYVVPSSGATGLSHTVSGVGLLQSVCITVRANATLSCQSSISASVCGCSNSPASVVSALQTICSGSAATFNVMNPAAGITYNWFSSASGGTPLTNGGNYTINAAGTTLTINNVTANTSFYLEQSSAAGCTGSPRTTVQVAVLGALTQTTLTVGQADIGTTSITFRWTAVPGAASYQVSVDGGTTWVTPSSGAAGLSHTVSGLQPMQQACVRVRAIGTIACQTSETVAVCATTRPDEIFIPNTFTPNGDGKNDQLVAFGWAIQSIQFMVFNQWGEKIHEINSTAQNNVTGGFVVWDGRYQGKVQPVGVYVYAAKITLKDGTVIQKSGALNIIR